MAAQPLPSSWSAQSRSAYGAPYLCHGRPQCAFPPRNSNAIPCMWPSSRPFTSPYGGEPVAGLPCTLSWASGYLAQPVARTSLNASPSPAGTETRLPASSIASARPDGALVIRNDPPPPVTVHSARELGAVSTITAPPFERPMKSRAGP